MKNIMADVNKFICFDDVVNGTAKTACVKRISFKERQPSRFYASNLKVAGSVPDKII